MPPTNISFSRWTLRIGLDVNVDRAVNCHNFFADSPTFVSDQELPEELRTKVGHAAKFGHAACFSAWYGWKLKTASKIVLMEEIRPTSWYGKIHYLQGFIHVGWCRISSINSMLATGPFHPVLLTLRARCDMWSLLYLLHLAPSLPGAENVPSRFLLKPPASKCLKIYQIFYRTWVNLSSEFTHFWISKVFPGAKIEDKRFVSQLKTSMLPKEKMWKVLN